jgi:hypothetical protein
MRDSPSIPMSSKIRRTGNGISLCEEHAYRSRWNRHLGRPPRR